MGESLSKDFFVLRVQWWNLVDVGFRCRLSPSASESLSAADSKSLMVQGTDRT